MKTDSTPVTQSTTQEKKTLLFIVNPIAGTHDKEHWVRQAEKELSADYDVQIRYTEYAGHAHEIALQAVQNQVYMVIAVGGDGTVNEIASALVHSDVILDIFPLGSGNGLARDLGLFTLFPHQAIQWIRKAQVLTMDCGQLDDKYFFCTFGAGFDARISELFAQNKGRGFFNYFHLCLHTFFHYQPIEYTFILDGVEHKAPLFLFNCANIKQFGNNAYIAPQADFTDGLFEITGVRSLKLASAVRLGLSLFTRRLNKMPEVENFQAKEVELRLPESAACHMDGEWIEHHGQTMKVRVIPQSLHVLHHLSSI